MESDLYISIKYIKEERKSDWLRFVKENSKEECALELLREIIRIMICLDENNDVNLDEVFNNELGRLENMAIMSCLILFYKDSDKVENYFYYKYMNRKKLVLK